MKTFFYEFNQNNSGGSFVVDDKLCHRVIIEAKTEEEAISKAEELGCYWNGVDEGQDCECCGDRWYPSPDCINLETINKNGWEVRVFGERKGNKEAEKEWESKYGHLTMIESPQWSNKYNMKTFTGKAKFETIDSYLQFMADEHGWTSPDIRIFYLNGEVKEIFSRKFGRPIQN